MKKIVLLIILGILSIIIGASILNKENNKPKNGEVSKKQNAHLLSPHISKMYPNQYKFSSLK